MYIKTEIWINELEEAGSDEPGVMFEANVIYEPASRDWYEEVYAFQEFPERYDVEWITWEKRLYTDQENQIIHQNLGTVEEYLIKACKKEIMSFDNY